MGVKRNIPQPPIKQAVNRPSAKRFGDVDLRTKEGRALKSQAQGVGDSKRFNAPDGTFEDQVDWTKVTVNGDPLPENCWTTFPYSLTDQGKAESAENIASLPLHLRPGGGMRDRTPYDAIADDSKKVNRYRDELTDAPPSMTPTQDPMAVLMKRHTPVGHRGLFIGKRKLEEAGLMRGMLEYEPVMVANKKTGIMERVTCGGMFLASVPEASAQQADRYYQSLNREKSVQAQEKVQEQADRIMGATGFMDLAKRKRLLDDVTGSHDDDPATADRELLQHESA